MVRLFFISKSKKNSTKVATSNFFLRLLIFFIVLAWIIKLSALHEKEFKNIYTIVIFRLDAIAYGILAYWAFYSYNINKKNSNALLSISIVLITLAVTIKFTCSDVTVSGIAYYLIAGIGYALFVLALSIYPWRNTFRVVSHISKISYSIYITHLSLILLPLRKFYQPNTLFQKVAFLFVYTMLVYLVSIITYTMVEKPFNKIRDRCF